MKLWPHFISANVVAIAVIWLLPSVAFAREPLRYIRAVVVKVVDGDTITAVDPLGAKLRIRLYGIDAPELERVSRRTGRVTKAGQSYGTEAYTALYKKTYFKEASLDVMAIDRYKRLVCFVWLGSRNINKEMVAEGWAWAYRDFLDSPYASDFINLEAQARAKRIGLWQQNLPQPPWEFRRQLKLK